MAAYMIFIREGEVFDPVEMDLYRNSNRDRPGQHALKPLVVYGEFETVEGEAPDGIVVLEFSDMAAAKAWYYSPEYQAAAVHRKKAADYRVIMISGVQNTP